MKEFITRLMSGKKIAILGFGREGRSTCQLLREYLPDQPLIIADGNTAIADDPLFQTDPMVSFMKDDHCLAEASEFDFIMKAPGIPAHAFPQGTDKSKITSQTDLFLQRFAGQVIGVTGTKGKSTTSSLIHHILTHAGTHSMLVGNIGIPPFESIPEITTDTLVVMELSSHQLEYLSRSPHIAILLNIFQEHLDHYNSYEDYQKAKLNIGLYQDETDYFIYNQDNQLLSNLVSGCKSCVHHLLPYSLEFTKGDGIFRQDNRVMLRLGNIETAIFDTTAGIKLPGDHNFTNCMAAAAACHLSGVAATDISSGISSFNGLEHRIERVGEYGGIIFYNDSIATIPEATIEAVKTLQNVDTLILGGYDRGIDYGILYPFLQASGIRNLIFIGEAGSRMRKELMQSAAFPGNLYLASDYTEVVTIAKQVTGKGKICLLSPAASSYDMFRNFEHRGNIFKKNVRN